jgi:hypothetical protein
MFDILFWFFFALWTIFFIADIVCLANKNLREKEYYLCTTILMLICNVFMSTIQLIEVYLNG